MITLLLSLAAAQEPARPPFDAPRAEELRRDWAAALKIEPEIRNDHVERAMADPAVGLVLVDLVLGFGSHENPAGVLLKAIKGEKPIIASVTGTEQDPQVWSRQVALLRQAGVLVAASNAQAAEAAASFAG